VVLKVAPFWREESLWQTLGGVRVSRSFFNSSGFAASPGRWNTSGRRPLIRMGYELNFVRLKLPRACQSPACRAVIDDNDLFWRQVWPSESIAAPTHSSAL
jgi:hypothetical protein